MTIARLDPLKVWALVYCTEKRFAFLPELLRIIGEAPFVRLLTSCSGSKMILPTHQQFVRTMTAVRMWFFVQENLRRGVSEREAVVLAVRYFRSNVRTVNRAVERVEQRLEFLSGEETKTKDNAETEG